MICQRNCDEEVNMFAHNSKSSFLSSDEICNKFIYEYGSLDQIQAGDIKMVYPDISCCKSYTSKHNISVYVGRKCGTTGSDQDCTASTILTRSQSGPIDWNVCIFCNNKTYTTVKTLKKIESIERISRILDAPNHYSDSNMTHKTSQEHFKERAKSKEPTDDQLLRSIAKIIRNDIAKVECSTEHDPTPADASLSHSFHYMPNSLIQLLNWVTNDKAFNAGDNTPIMQTDGLRKYYEQIECIVAISRNMFTPFHLGLAIQVYRGLIKPIQKLPNSNGLCSSYTELRRFQTSVANHELEHINLDRYIPSVIRPIIQGGHLNQEGSDNIDINAERVDGKNTFHSLARAVF